MQKILKIHEIYIKSAKFVLFLIYNYTKRNCSQLKQKMGTKRPKSLVSCIFLIIISIHKIQNKWFTLLWFNIVCKLYNIIVSKFTDSSYYTQVIIYNITAVYQTRVIIQKLHNKTTVYQSQIIIHKFNTNIAWHIQKSQNVVHVTIIA